MNGRKKAQKAQKGFWSCATRFRRTSGVGTRIQRFAWFSGAVTHI